MTFVVARRLSSGVRMLGDLRATKSDEVSRGYPIAVLKTVALSRDLAVAYAGNLEHAMDVVRGFVSSGDGRAETLLDAVEESCERADGDVAYLVATANMLWRVTAARGVERNLATAHIGTPEPFEIYQRGYHEAVVTPPLVAPGISPDRGLPVTGADYEATVRMMHGVFRLEQEAPADVGEAFIMLSGGRRGFRYEQQAMLVADHEQVVESSEGWALADWGTVAEGGFGYAVLVPVEAGIGAIGLYFPHASLGLYYAPLERDEPWPYPRVSREDFLAGVRRDHGVVLDGPAFG